MLLLMVTLLSINLNTFDIKKTPPFIAKVLVKVQLVMFTIVLMENIAPPCMAAQLL